MATLYMGLNGEVLCEKCKGTARGDSKLLNREVVFYKDKKFESEIIISKCGECGVLDSRTPKIVRALNTERTWPKRADGTHIEWEKWNDTTV